MIRPDYVPDPAWRWLQGEVVDISMFQGAEAAVPGLVGPDMEPSWRAWAAQIDTELGWRLLCDFLALLPWTYQPENIAKAGRLREEWDQFTVDLEWLALRATDIHRRGLEIGLEFPLSEHDLKELGRLAEAVHYSDAKPVIAPVDYLLAGRPSTQAFVHHFDAAWVRRKHCRALRRVQMSHEDVARIGAATRVVYCTADAVRKARQRNRVAPDPHDPERGCIVLRNSKNTDPDK